MFRSWNEIGRPTSFEEIVGQPDFLTDAKEWVTSGDWPTSLLLHGPPGTGKTSAARVIAKTYLGEYLDPVNFIETNASDDRGIDFVRHELKQMASTKGLGVDRKVILLDEADGLTPTAQDAARQIIENHSDTAFIILTANNLEKVRPAIRSRCILYPFKPIDIESGIKHLQNVCHKVSLRNDVRGQTYDAHTKVYKHWEEDFPRLIHAMNGDLRACVAVLESLNKHRSSLSSRIKDLDTIGQAALSALGNEWLQMRVELHSALGAPHYRTKEQVMRSFYNNLSSFFGTEDDKVWRIMAIYGDMMIHTHEWPDTGEAFLDYFVAKIKQEVEKND